ncbi:hypothetical protein ACW7EJ_13135, partial [Acinetobacter soli]
GLLGLLSGILGLVVAGVLVWNVYGSLPLTELLFLMSTLFLPSTSRRTFADRHPVALKMAISLLRSLMFCHMT